MLVDVIPSGADRLRALGDLAGIPEIRWPAGVQRERVDHRLRAVIDTCRNSPLEWDWLLRALLDSGDPVMRIYAQLEQLPS